jgi:hypothetical protein
LANASITSCPFSSQNHLIVPFPFAPWNDNEIGAKVRLCRGGFLNLPPPSLDRRARHAERQGRIIERQAGNSLDTINRH